MIIKIKVNPDSENQEYTFEKETIIIGSEFSSVADITLKGSSVHEEHAKITLQKGKFYLINEANDPLISLNGNPFGKKALKSLDTLSIAEHTILFEEVQKAPEKVQIEDNNFQEEEEEAAETPFSEYQEEENQEDVESFDFDQELNKLDQMFDLNNEEKESNLSNLDVEALFEEVDKLDLEQIEEPKKEGSQKESNQENTQDLTFEFAEEDEDDTLLEATGHLEQKKELEVENKAKSQEPSFADESTKEALLVRDSLEKDSSIEDSKADNEQNFEAKSTENKNEQQAEKSPDSDIEEDVLDKKLQVKDAQLASESEKPKEQIDLQDSYKEFEKARVAKPLNRNQMTTIAFVLSLLMMIALVTSYLQISKKEAKNSLNAAAVTADISLAMLFSSFDSQIQKSSQEEKIDQAFTKLFTPLSKRLPMEREDFDASYTLKIYQQEKTPFIVVAEPKDSFNQLFVSKPSFIYHSELSKLYKSNQEATAFLNNQVFNTEKKAKQAKETIAQMEVVTLEELSKIEGTNLGFNPAKTIDQTSFEAANNLYNAPRYYQMGSQIVEKASQLNKQELTSLQIDQLKNSLESLNQLEDFIFYSKLGEKEARQAKKVLSTYFPNKEFSIGFVEIDPRTKAARKGILLEKKEQKAGPLTVQNSEDDLLDTSHPLYIQLHTLVKQREQELKPKADALINVINTQTKKENSDFHEKALSLLEEYEKSISIQKSKLSQSIGLLYQEYVSNNPDEMAPLFNQFVKAVGLDFYLNQGLSTTAIEKTLQTTLSTRYRELINRVKTAPHLNELRSAVDHISQFIEEESLISEKEKISLKNDLRAAVLQKVGDFLLSPNAQDTQETFTVENRLVLDAILNGAEISEEEEKNFYLQEFDLLIERVRSEKKFSKDREKNTLKTLSNVLLDADNNEAVIGQKILEKAKTEKASIKRDGMLKQAINLLEGSTEENRAYWRDILEARYLLTETPKTKIEDLLVQNLSTKKEQSLNNEVRNFLKLYIKDLRAQLSTEKDNTLFDKDLENIKNSLLEYLTSAEIKAVELEETALSVMKEVQRYEERLNSLFADYKKAKEEGFFTSDRKLHTKNFNNLAKQSKDNKKLYQALRQASEKAEKAAIAYQTLIQQEKQKLLNNQEISHQEIINLERSSNKVFYPEAGMNALTEKIEETFARRLKFQTRS